jgi:MinD-like ATPase involved in chromosome partitioning or flagellar assembly
VDLPTYTNIWRIEKRLYKLYDLRLPMPLPLGQIAAFVGITVPYVLFLTLIGIPFSHNLFWLYVLPPGVLTWLVTRPVLENKKLPELLVSQVRYLGEPKIWCRMAPATEKDEIVVVGQVWHACRQPAAQAAAVEIRRQAPVPARVPSQPARTAPASSRQGPPADLRHRNPAAWGPRPAGPAATRVAVPDQRAAAGFAPPRARRGAGPAPDRHMVARGSPARQRAAATARPQPRPARSAASAPQGGQQPAWAIRARPGGSLGGPGETTLGGRAIEVAHAEQAWPAPSAADRALTPVPGLARHHPAAPAHAAPPPVPGPQPSSPSRDPRARTGQRIAPYVPDLDRAAPPGAARPAGRPAPPAQTASPGIRPPVSPVPVSSAPVPPPRVPAPPAAESVVTRPSAAVGQPVPPSVPRVAVGQGAGDRQRAGQPGPPGVPRAGAGPGAPPGVPRAGAGQGALPGVPRATVGRGAGDRPGGGQPGPAVTVRTLGEERPAPPVERALSGPVGPRGRSWNDRVRLVPGGQGPGQSRETEHGERGQARACLPLPGPRRIVVVGCTSGAGQTVTTLMVARLLASLRAERVAVLDLNPGSYSLTQRAETLPAGTVRDLLGDAASAGHPGPGGPVGSTGRVHPAPGIDVISAEAAPASVTGLDEADFSRIGDHLVARYGISLVDPGASSVARVLDIADQLVLVAPASADAPRAVAMTQEWLASHEHGALAANAVLVVNGVSGRSMADVQRAEAIAAGRCRAIVRVPWEDQLGADDGPCAGVVPLRPAPRRALTAVAGILMAGLATGPAAGSGVPR